MAYSNGIITAPVSIYDVQQALGNSSTDLGTLCTGSQINKWAKYKPVRLAIIDTVTGQWNSSNNTWLLTSTWWKAGGLCGFSTTVATEFGNSMTTPGTFMYNLINGQLGWTYNKPTGGSQQPYRLQDFASYYVGARAPYGEIGATTIYINTNGNAQIDWDVPAVNSNNLRLTDIIVNNHPLSDFYLGVILYNNSTWYLYTSSAKFSAGESLSITLTDVSSLAGTWNLMPFFTLNKVNSGGTFDANGLFISMADTTPISITLTTTGSVSFHFIEAIWNQTGTAATYELTIKNTTSSDRTFSSIAITIYGGSATGTSLGSVTLTSITVPANATRTFTGSIIASKSGYSFYWVVASTSGIQSINNMVQDYDDESL